MFLGAEPLCDVGLRTDKPRIDEDVERLAGLGGGDLEVPGSVGVEVGEDGSASGRGENHDCDKSAATAHLNCYGFNSIATRSGHVLVGWLDGDGMRTKRGVKVGEINGSAEGCGLCAFGTGRSSGVLGCG